MYVHASFLQFLWQADLWMILECWLLYMCIADLWSEYAICPPYRWEWVNGCCLSLLKGKEGALLSLAPVSYSGILIRIIKLTLLWTQNLMMIWPIAITVHCDSLIQIFLCPWINKPLYLDFFSQSQCFSPIFYYTNAITHHNQCQHKLLFVFVCLTS